MPIHIEVRKLICPHCGNIIEDMPIKANYFEVDKCIGVCKKCQLEYIHPHRKEWVTMTNEEKIFYIKSCYTIKYGFIGRLLGIDEFVFKPSMLNRYPIRKSIERTARKEYLEKLIQYGFTYYGENIER